MEKIGHIIDHKSRTTFKTQVSEMTSIDGEFRLIGRVGNETGTVLADFGSGPDQAIQIFAGGPIETQYMDGLKVSVLSSANMSMNVDLVTPIDMTMVPQGTRSLCE
jgi:hypothetical protein